MQVVQQSQKISITIAQGEDISPNGISNLQVAIPLNLTGYNFKCVIKFTNAITLTNLNGGIVVTQANPAVLGIVLTSAQTETIQPGSYPFDFWAENANVSPTLNTPLFAGSITITQSITPVP